MLCSSAASCRIIEQLQQWLRDLSRKGTADCNTTYSRMNACQTPNVLQSRGTETVTLTRDEFTAAMRGGVAVVGLTRTWSSTSQTLSPSICSHNEAWADCLEVTDTARTSYSDGSFHLGPTFLCPRYGFANNAEVSLGSPWLTRWQRSGTSSRCRRRHRPWQCWARALAYSQ